MRLFTIVWRAAILCFRISSSQCWKVTKVLTFTWCDPLSSGREAIGIDAAFGCLP
jgi:hypothetical protein